MNKIQQSPMRVVVAALAVVACAASWAAAEELVPLELTLPSAAFKGTPRDLSAGSSVEPLSDKPRPAILVPRGCVNLASKLMPSASDPKATPEQLKKITDGDKRYDEDSIVLLHKGVQYIQFDLGKPAELHAIVIWHAHDVQKIYRGVVVQIADDARFTVNVRTLYNNDRENMAGRGIGTDRPYYESREGKLVEAKGQKARFVRLYSRGSTESAMNEYTEVEVWGKPVS